MERNQNQEYRLTKRELLRRELEQNSRTYALARWSKKYLDDYKLDPIIGFIFPAVGDILTMVFALPFVYLAIFRVKSISLTLAVIYNILLDALLGLIPFGIGAVLDIFSTAFKKNYQLIVGFVEGDEAVIREVNKRAVFMGIAIPVFCVLIYWLCKLAIGLVGYLIDLVAPYISSLF